MNSAIIITAGLGKGSGMEPGGAEMEPVQVNLNSSSHC